MEEASIEALIKKLAQTGAEIYAKVAKVLEVRTDLRQIDVAPIDGTATIFNVRLQADDAGIGLLKIPKVGSMVVVVFITKHQAVMVNDSGLEAFICSVHQNRIHLDKDKLELLIGGNTFEIDQHGFLLKKQNETLKILISDLISAIQNMSFLVATPDTLTGTTTQMTNLPEFMAIKTRFNQFLK